MSKAIWWIIVIVVVVGGIYYLSNKSAVVDDNEVTPTSEEADDQGSFNTASSDQKSLAELMALGTAQQCTFNQSLENSTNSGTFYLGLGQMRGDFTSVDGGQTTQIHMISDSKDVYTWIEGMNLGFKASASAGQPTASGTPANNNGVDVNQKLAYNCSPWTADSSKFTLPTGIQFNAPGMMAPPASR